MKKILKHKLVITLSAILLIIIFVPGVFKPEKKYYNHNCSNGSVIENTLETIKDYFYWLFDSWFDERPL